MRLEKVHSGHRLKERLMLRMMGLVLRTKKLDAPRTMLYRREFFGAPFGKLSQQIMRGSSDWSIGERELMAAFVSHVNQCPF
jgi:hypothetical protein